MKIIRNLTMENKNVLVKNGRFVISTPMYGTHFIHSYWLPSCIMSTDGGANTCQQLST